MDNLDPGKRLYSLDVFRGITIAGMLLVNNPGTWKNIYSPLRHAQWHGWTPTDLVFPFFLFIVGVSLSFSLSKRIERGDKTKKLIVHVIKRSFALFSLGLCLHFISKPSLSTLRIPGVLPRIGVCYFFASLIILKTSLKGRTITGILLLLTYWLAIKLIPVPGYGAGDLSFEGNLCGYIDTLLLKGHLYKESFDPEGILSTIPAIVTVLIGVYIGEWIRSSKSKIEISNGLFVSGLFLVFAGYIWSIWLPINKQLWTNSYSFLTAGLGTVFLALIYWMIEIKNYKKWSIPFVIFGMNAIATYFLSTLMAIILYKWKIRLSHNSFESIKTIIYKNIFEPLGNPEFCSLLFALCFVALWVGIMYFFYRKKVFIKI